MPLTAWKHIHEEIVAKYVSCHSSTPRSLIYVTIHPELFTGSVDRFKKNMMKKPKQRRKLHQNQKQRKTRKRWGQKNN